ncbi:response regulator transcription factor [Arachnia propionica]|uniref:Response regulator transcription factor n=1 Tax=Arachnia propionica TaxID=1750 RepID=A0AB37HWW1_9ACTN|nr:response regulator transcription factor [Arachnia propionica]AFN45875.1 response regulator receiver domain protein [Arachnia propionica F0230a]QCT36745.1 response regulator transcription factor [Arachnia propionica]QUC10917.1 response regulator transcription factor [Arachnia propionica]RPA17795.1 DNA-binding response regulator [Arachnia propionica]
MITVALVDDDPMVRTGLNFILKGEDGIDVAWQAGDGAEALTKLRDRPVDVVLLDVRMPGLDGLATLEELRGWQTRPRVIVLTTFNTDNYVVRALKLGADAFLLKDADPARLVEAIQRVAAGENVLAPDVTRTLITVATDAPAAGDPSARALVAALTEREREVAVLMTQGLTNNQIGTRLHLSLASVKSHLTSLFVKLGVDNRVSAAMIIRDAGL